MKLPRWLSPRFLAPTLLLACGLAAIYFTRPATLRLDWNDEILYYTTARNIYERHSLDSHHYLTESLLKKGYPTRDFHPPGYPLLLAGAFLLSGPDESVAFFLNYFLLLLTLFLLYRLGAFFSGPWIGLSAALLYLLFPLTLPFVQSQMSEPSAAAAVVFVAACYFLLGEGWLKGSLLALSGLLAGLIKPPLLALIPALLAAFLYERRPGYRKSLLAFACVFAGLFLGCYLPANAQREYYPIKILEFGQLQTWPAKLDLIRTIFQSNAAAFGNILSQANGQGIASRALLSLLVASLLLTGAAWAPAGRDPVRGKSLRAFFFWSLSAFLLVGLAVFCLYEYASYRGPRSLSPFVPLLSLLIAVGLDRRVPAWMAKGIPIKPIVIGLLVLAGLGYYYQGTKTTWRELQAARHRDGVFLRNAANRVIRAGEQLRLHPGRILSQGNFYFPVQSYPSEVIWSPPKSLAEFTALTGKISMDLVEFRENDRILVEKKRRGENLEELPGGYRLVRRQGDYYYYAKGWQP